MQAPQLRGQAFDHDDTDTVYDRHILPVLKRNGAR